MLLKVAHRARLLASVDLLLVHAGAARARLAEEPVVSRTHRLDSPRKLRCADALPLMRSLREHAAVLAGRKACCSFSWPAVVRSALASSVHGCRLAWLCQEEIAAQATARRRAAVALLAARGVHIICPSENIEHQLLSLGYPRTRLQVIRNGVDTRWYRPPSFSGSDKAALRARHGLAEAALTVLCPARLDANKRQETLIRAVAIAQRARVDVQLVCAGEEHSAGGKMRERLQRLAGELQVAHRVRLIGHQPDLRPWLALADAVSLASLHEAAPLALAEAAAAGCALVVSRVGGVAELVQHGETGLLFDAEDAETCARHWGRLAGSSELLAALGRRARLRCVAHFSEEAANRRWDTFLARLLGAEVTPC